MKTKSFLTAVTVAALCAAESFAAPMGTAFTYQGRLNDGGQPANNLYDLTFTLHDDPVNATTIGTYIILSAVPVTNGLFTVQLNAGGEFGQNAFNGQARWLQIGVRTNSANNAFNNFTFLTARQSLTPAPYALFASNAMSALNASMADNVADGAVTWLSISGIPAGFADGVDNDTTYSAGAGLSLSGANQFSVNFGGSGNTAAAARSDHGHFGAKWGGDTSFGLGLSVTNGAGNGAGLYGQQGVGSGFPYLFGNTAGVWGESSEGSGVWGASAKSVGVRGISLGTNGYGVHGAALASHGTNYGVYGECISLAGSGVRGRQGDGNGLIQMGVAGVWGDSEERDGVFGTSRIGAGVNGWSENGYGVNARSIMGVGLKVYSASNNVIEGYTSGFVFATRVFRVTREGEVYASGSFHPNGADFAEMLPARDSLEAGDVLVIGEDGKLARSTQPYQENVAGVHATKPGLLGGAHDGADLTGKSPLAVVGIVPVKVASENGPVKPGDKLTTSSTPGHAMRADKHAVIGTVIGKALEPLRGESGVIQMLVILQ